MLESNRQGRRAWERYAGHRERVMQVLTESAAATRASSLCLLGGGNLNDVSVAGLLEEVGHVHVADVDLDAVSTALAAQGSADDERIHVHAPVDLSGVLHLLPAGPGMRGRAAGGLIEMLSRHRCDVGGAPFDLTASTCVLTQLLQSVVDASLSEEAKVRVSLALRDKHLADLLRLTRPGGVAILVTDVVSTTTAPELRDADGEGAAQLEETMARLVAAGNFFTGTNPYRVVALLEEDDRFRPGVDEVRLLDPWLWAVTDDREHLTYAIVVRRAGR